MIKIFCLLGLLMAFNVHADLDLAAVFSGKSDQSVCFLYTTPGDFLWSKTISCGGKAGGVPSTNMKKYIVTLIADFVESGRWNLTATFIGKENQTIFVFTKK